MKRLLAQAIQAIVNVDSEDSAREPSSCRRAKRPGLHNGFSWRKLSTRLGVIELLVPHARDAATASALFERYQAREGAFLTALGRMCVRGTATGPAVREAVEDLCGHVLSAEAVATLVDNFNTELASYLRRQLEREHPALSAEQRLRSSVLHYADA